METIRRVSVKDDFILEPNLSSCFYFLSAAIAAWYEGSSILEDPWEWEYSTPFSHWLNGEVTDPGDILFLDHFI